MSALSPNNSSNPRYSKTRVIKVALTIAAMMVALLVMNTLRSDSNESATTISTHSLLTVPGASDPTATPTAIPTTAPVIRPTPTSTPAPTATAAPTPEPTAAAPAAAAARAATAAPVEAIERSGEVSVAGAGATASSAAVDPAPQAPVAEPTTTVLAAPAPTEIPAMRQPTATFQPAPTATLVAIEEPTPLPTLLPTTPPTPSPTPSPAPPPPTPTRTPVQSVAQLESYVLGEINQVRANVGLGPLVIDNAISAISRDWSQQMAVGGFFRHRPGAQLNVMLPAGWSQWGENIASAPDIFWAQSSLEQSPGHYANMVGPFTHVGIGVYSNGSQVWVTQNFARY